MANTISAPAEDHSKMRLAMGFSFVAHAAIFAFFILAATLSNHHSSEVPLIELVQLEAPRIRPLQPKVKTPELPAPEPEPTRPEEAPKLTPAPTKPDSKKPDPKVVKRDVDSTLKVKNTAEAQPDMPQQLTVSTSTDPRLSQWINRVKKKADLLWNPPAGLEVPAATKVKVSFTVQRDGLVENAKIAASSNNSLLDENALNTVIRLDHVPPIPPNYPEDQIDVGIEFPYQAQ